MAAVAGVRLVAGTAAAPGRQRPSGLHVAHAAAIGEVWLAVRDHGPAAGLALRRWWSERAGWQEWESTALGWGSRIRRLTAAFDVDFDTCTVTCPRGKTKTSTAWSLARQRGVQTVVVRLDTDSCRACPVKPQCTTARRGGRQLTIRPRRVHEALTQARARQNTAGFQQTCRLRAGVEGTIRQAVAVTDTRYRGVNKTYLEQVVSAVALNFIGLDAWFIDVPLDRTRTNQLTSKVQYHYERRTIVDISQ
ncbi:transposase [Micromonospora sp. CB01531]|uniref:transposase n=1 Tax=Micromonospora sp. CB01531 TaxID=1718947 RepID=UPI00093DBF80|nr:transposase [Micromonospora sp. CB01531]OKI46823.1 hypothetical protein A6A27_36825 [Micromonospora sp. CB01531]